MGTSCPPLTPNHALRALLVEDNEDDRELFLRTLRDCDQSSVLECARSVDEAIDHLARSTSQPDVIFVDVHLPGVSGAELVKSLRSSPACGKALIVAVTGDLQFASSLPGPWGTHAVLMKPVAAADLEAMLALADVIREP